MTRMIPRLFVDAPLIAGQAAPLNSDHAHYLRTVLRMETNEEIIIFNGEHGEWRATLANMKKGGGIAQLHEQLRPQHNTPDVWLLFAPLKSARIDMIAEKASELGASLLWPVFTQRSQPTRVNTERLSAHAREAAEQCERLDVPLVRDAVRLDTALIDWEPERRLLVCAERSDAKDMATTLPTLPAGPAAILVGPEGGFSPEELARLERLPYVTFVTLGPRILRAETACFTALTIWQALKGDWAA